jgi:hypothetical protein
VGRGRIRAEHAALRVELLEDTERLRIVVADGFEVLVPLQQVCGYGAEEAGSEGIWLRIAAVVNDANGDYRVEFESTSLPDGAREALLEQLNARVGSRVVRSRFQRKTTEVPEAPAPAPPTSRVRGSGLDHTAAEDVPPPSLRGPTLSAAAGDPDWLMLWPLEDTVALSRGQLLPPPSGA